MESVYLENTILTNWSVAADVEFIRLDFMQRFLVTFYVYPNKVPIAAIRTN